jgi:putative transposase
MIATGMDDFSLNRQLSLLGVGKSSWYHEPVPETELNLALMLEIDQQYLKTPFYGVPRMRNHLVREGHAVSYNRVERLYRLMGLKAIYPGPRTSIPGEGEDHKVYPYLLHGLDICRPNMVWCTDITYVPMRSGFMYLVAIMDWHSRFVLAWELSNSMDVGFCIKALKRALETGKPEIFNSDQGSQFTCGAYRKVLDDAGIRISMDGKGRYLDNIFIERLWRSVKYEHIYIHAHEDGKSLWKGLDGYFNLHNNEKPHQALDYATPGEVYWA